MELTGSSLTNKIFWQYYILYSGDRIVHGYKIICYLVRVKSNYAPFVSLNICLSKAFPRGE